jgi:putative spermidine/putrescine transport system ATP-binding protein
MTIAENIAFGLEMRNVPKAERETRVAKALDLVKLTGLGGRKVGQLSGGQQQRAAIARSLVIEPALLLLDEPLSNLDAKLRDEMRDEIREIQARTGVTAIFVTHDQDEALSMADRVAVMSNGKIEQIGTPRDIFERPATDFVARFIGVGNFFTGTVTGNGVAKVDGLGEVNFVGDAATGSSVKLMLRPHRIAVGNPGVQGANQFTGTVEHIVYRGEILSMNVAVGLHRIQTDSLTRAAIIPRKGDVVGLSIMADDVTVIPGMPQ